MARSNQHRLAPGALEKHENGTADAVESTQSASDVLAELSKMVETGTASVADLKRVRDKIQGKATREPKVKAEKKAATLEDVIVQQSTKPSPWLIVNLAAPALRRVAISGGQLDIADALSDVASLYAQLAHDAIELRPADKAGEPFTETVGRLMTQRFPDQTARLGQRFGQAAKPAPHARAQSEDMADEEEDDEFDEADVESAEETVANLS